MACFNIVNDSLNTIYACVYCIRYKNFKTRYYKASDVSVIFPGETSSVYCSIKCEHLWIYIKNKNELFLENINPTPWFPPYPSYMKLPKDAKGEIVWNKNGLKFTPTC